MKKVLVSMILAASVLAVTPAWAHGDGKMCATQGQGMDCDTDDMCPVASKFFKKAHFLLSNADEIGLSEDQVKQIRTLKTDVKKGSIRGMAEMEIFTMDVQAKMSEDVVDVEGLNTMIDGFGQGMTAQAKKTVEAYAKMKALLTPEQLAKAKEIWKKKS